jgi:DNA invertase Pin-like site-specific DNA recombinase
LRSAGALDDVVRLYAFIGALVNPFTIRGVDRQALKRELARTGRQRTTARDKLAEADAETARLAKQAIASGIPKREIARLVSVSRPTLDAILRRADTGARAER